MSDEKSPTQLNLKVLTPEGSVLEGEVTEVSLPGSEGEMGVFPQHAALLTRIVPGKLAYRAPEGDDSAALGRGVAEVQGDQVTVLVDRAVLREEIDVPSLEVRRKQLLEALDKETHAEKLAGLEEEILLTDVQLQVGRGGE